MLFANVFTKVSQRLKSKELTRHMRRHTHTQSRARTLSRYRSRISSPQLAHTFFPVDGTDEALDGGEQMDGVDGGLGEERGSSFSILDLWDSPSDCQWKLEQCISHFHVNDVYLLDRNILRKIIQPSKTENVKKKSSQHAVIWWPFSNISNLSVKEIETFQTHWVWKARVNIKW